MRAVSLKNLLAPPGRGFTLTELLVVLGIVAILVILSFSAFSRTAEMSKAARCTGNLRQLAAAFNLYTQEHEGNFPQIYRIGSSGHWYYNADFLSLLNISSANMWAGRSGLYLCPSDTNGQKKISVDGKTRFLSYAANINLGAGESGTNTSPYYTALKVSRLEAPSKLLMLSDADTFFFVPGGGEKSMSYRHRGGLNVVFADGHAEWRKAPIATNSNEDPWLWWPDGIPK